MRLAFFVFLLFGSSAVFAQLVLPEGNAWKQVDEGKALAFQIKTAEPGKLNFSVEGSEGLGMTIDSLGNFSWTPSFDLVDRNTKQKEFPVIFQATLKDSKRLRESVTFTVHHINRPPVVDELPVFYVRQGIQNRFRLSSDFVRDPDGDPVVFISRKSQMPEGAELNSLGQFSWTPSRSQFAMLKNGFALEFIVEDQPDKAQTIGKVNIAQTQMDLPPEIVLVPADSIWTMKENEVLYLKVYVADPNGDENIDQVDFISTDMRIPKSVMKENSKAQREFAWTPGYDFVEEVEKTREVLFTFFAFDKSSNRAQKKVRVTVTDTENVEEKDRLLNQKYIGTLGAACNLIGLLDVNNEKLEKIHRKAKSGKKNRTIINASLGAMTGLSPLVLPTDPSKTVSVVGGTSVLTINSLEAGQVIGKNANDYQGRIKSNRDLRTQLQLKGNFFARKYALRSARRSVDFEQDRDEITRMMNSDAVSAMELSAQSQAAPSLKEIKKMFPDFSEEKEQSQKN